MLPSNLLSETIQLIAKDLSSSINLLVIGASKALGEAGRYTSLPAFLNIDDKGKEKMDDNLSSVDMFTDIVDKLITIVKTTKDVKVYLHFFFLKKKVIVIKMMLSFMILDPRNVYYYTWSHRTWRT